MTIYGVILLVLWVVAVVGIVASVVARWILGNVEIEEYRKRTRR